MVLLDIKGGSFRQHSYQCLAKEPPLFLSYPFSGLVQLVGIIWHFVLVQSPVNKNCIAIRGVSPTQQVVIPN